MTQNEKDLLLKDLCGRLPYGVKILTYASDDFYDPSSIETLYEIDRDGYISTVESDTLRPIGKPYLFPLSSISEDQKYDFYCRFIKNDCNFDDFKKFYLYNGMWRRKLLTFTSLYDIEAIIDWFHKNHIDYRDLIPMGLAIDATELNIY